MAHHYPLSTYYVPTHIDKSCFFFAVEMEERMAGFRTFRYHVIAAAQIFIKNKVEKPIEFNKYKEKSI